jgi:hypothetical protein
MFSITVPVTRADTGGTFSMIRQTGRQGLRTFG